MSVGAFLKRVTQRDTCVYWSAPTNNADGTRSYGTPVELGCVWKDDVRLITDFWEKEFASRAHVYTNIDLDEMGMIYHGTLSDLTTAEKNDPSLIAEAWEIKRFMKTPSLHIRNSYDRKSFI